MKMIDMFKVMLALQEAAGEKYSLDYTLSPGLSTIEVRMWPVGAKVRLGACAMTTFDPSDSLTDVVNGVKAVEEVLRKEVELMLQQLEKSIAQMESSNEVKH